MYSADIHDQQQPCYAPLSLHAKTGTSSDLLTQQLRGADDFAGKIAQ
jgi:hypothetical protein